LDELLNVKNFQATKAELETEFVELKSKCSLQNEKLKKENKPHFSSSLTAATHKMKHFNDVSVEEFFKIVRTACDVYKDVEPIQDGSCLKYDKYLIYGVKEYCAIVYEYPDNSVIIATVHRQ